MKISKTSDDSLVLKDGEDIIETYSFTEEINFAGLMKFLLKKNMTKQFTLDCGEDEFTDQEKDIINIIRKVLEKYNDGVDEIKKMKSSDQ